MEDNKEDESSRAKDIVEKKMQNRDYSGALEVAVKARQLALQLFQDMKKISQMITVCDVHCAADRKLFGDEMDWYAILKVKPTHYRKLCRQLHPDKNKFPGAEAAFKLIGDAQTTLLDQTLRSAHDMKGKVACSSNGQPTFWTKCPYCMVRYQYHTEVLHRLLRCETCNKSFIAYDFGAVSQANIPCKGNLSDEEHNASHPKKAKRNINNVLDDSVSDSSSGETKEPLMFAYPDPEFNDFDKDKKEECFSVGQVWASYDTLDAMPRFYARIKKVFCSGFKLRITWLEPDPDDENEIEWFSEGLPVSCGKFKLRHSENIEDRLMFSHLVYWEKGTCTDGYKIFPRKGETWALFKNWNIKWKSDQKFEYEFVEILSDYDEGIGTNVAYLTKVKGSVSVFCKRGTKDGVDTFLIPPNDLFRFSHKVPSFPLTGKERKGLPKRSLELDPGSLPEEILVPNDMKVN